MATPYIPVSKEKIENALREAPYYVDTAIQVLEEYLDQDSYCYVSEMDVAVLAAAMSFDARYAENVLTFIRGQILDWLYSR